MCSSCVANSEATAVQIPIKTYEATYTNFSSDSCSAFLQSRVSVKPYKPNRSTEIGYLKQNGIANSISLSIKLLNWLTFRCFQ